MAQKKCANCCKTVRHPVIDWNQRYAWCAPCWRQYLEDYRAANPDETPPKKAA